MASAPSSAAIPALAGSRRATALRSPHPLGALMPSMTSLLNHQQFDITSAMETFATALLGDLRLVISRLATTEGELFHLNFLDSANENKAIVNALKLDPETVLAVCQAGASLGSPAQHCAVVAHALEHGGIRQGLASELRGQQGSLLIVAMLGAIDAARESAEIDASLQGGATNSSRKLSL